MAYGICTRTSIFDGLDLATLQSRLTALQLAMLDLEAGARVAKATYSQGDGSRSVEYTQADRASLTRTILALQSQIDYLNGNPTNRVKPLRPYIG